MPVVYMIPGTKHNQRARNTVRTSPVYPCHGQRHANIILTLLAVLLTAFIVVMSPIAPSYAYATELGISYENEGIHVVNDITLDTEVRSLTGVDAIDEQYDNKNSNTSHYMDINLGGFLNGTANGSILQGGVNILEMIVNTLVIPISILVAAWHMIYIAIFPLMAGIDPLNMMSRYQAHDGKFLKFKRAPLRESGGADNGIPSSIYGSSQPDPHKVLLDEVKHFIIYLLIICCMWVVFQLIMWAVVAIVSLF